MKGASAAVAIAVKDWTRFARQPFLMVISVVIPLVFIFFYSLIIPVSNNNPIMVADLDGGPVSSRLIETMRTIHSEEGPYYDVRTTDATAALEAFDDGDHRDGRDGLDGIVSVAADGRPATTRAVLDWFVERDGDAVLVGVRRPDLNDVFLALTGTALRDGGAA